jgi:hypothetical protein
MTDYTNPRGRLALRTSSQQSVPRRQNAFMTTVNRIFNTCIKDSSLHGSSISITAGDPASRHKPSTNLETAFNIHNSHQHHRDRSPSGFLLVS